ncbi:probable LRR receptor-like serine/threonine-protein kinase At1g51810 isoform X2 [Cucumis sativus]|uniref:probable LRR receptor-like serine/threonine-protein kinase At1g51810 isoform X2 n=1 Tax=Cucumis sativus TaxID=3659 RepID=UPI0012F52390|nr:probable LRR receptor-like serine/threonine-protein kinase At1g51810 isoform X2 [Cucumis sativus]
MVAARFGQWNLLLNHHGRKIADGNHEREIEKETNMIKEVGRLNKKGQPAFSGIIVDGGGARWLDGGDVQSAKWRHHLVAIHICEVLDGLKFSESFPVMKTNEIRGSDSGETFAKKLIKRLAKRRGMAMMLEFDPIGPLGNWVSLAKYYCNQLPATSIVVAVHKGKTIFKRQSVDQFRGFELHLRPEFYFSEVISTSRNLKPAKGDNDELLAADASDDWDAETNSRNGNVNSHDKKALLSSISIVRRQLPESNLGWPFQQRSSQAGREVIRKGARNVSVVQWVMSLPNRSGAGIPKSQNDMTLEIPKICLQNKSEGMEETNHLVLQNFGDEAEDSDENLKGGELVNEFKHNAKMGLSVSFIVKEFQQEMPGWPLRPDALSERSDSLQESEETDIQEGDSETSISNRTIDTNLESQIGSVAKNLKEREERVIFFHSEEKSIENNIFKIASKQLEFPIKMNQSVCKCFSYAELKMATSNFSAENLIGEGGYSAVYKGCLLDGTSVVVKVLKSYKDARDNFLLELNIVSSIKHNHITPPIGVCMENEHLISVYDYFPEGSLEENLHGQSGRSKIQWEMRFKVAIAVAEALNYLHNERSSPVIHRDVKSSNVLLSEKFQPQLSDFGLAMWGPTDSPYVINTDVVGTFGYIAPEYLMHGKLSDKIDIYAFGIVLLELLSGRRPIDFGVAEGQRSLVLWAKEVLNSENPKALMDPNMDIKFNDDQVQRVVLAATLCINASARLRPNASEILKLLKGEARVDDFINFPGSKELTDHDIDDIFPKFMSKPSLSFALRDIDNDCTPSSNANTTSNTMVKKPGRLKLKDYLKEPHE